MKHFWYIWSKAMGEKAHEDDRIADQVAVIKSFIVIIYLITNFFIVAGIIRHW